MVGVGANPKVCGKQTPVFKSRPERPMPKALMTQRLRRSVQMPVQMRGAKTGKIRPKLSTLKSPEVIDLERLKDKR
jgi:hypothetical protein